MIRKYAIVNEQCQKDTCATSTSFETQAKKPLISEHHLTKRFTNGVMEYIIQKNPGGFI
jgi:hypothetical protein